MRITAPFALAFIFVLSACKQSKEKKIESTIAKYVKEHVRNAESYSPISFSKLDTIDPSDYLNERPEYKYFLEHTYEIENADKQKVVMEVEFQFDSTFKLVGSYPDGLNGDYGQLTGNVYWKYNDYVGNKPDAGSKVTLYAIDSIRKDLKYKAECDVMGNFKIDKILPGYYMLIVQSKNTTNSPDEHLQSLLTYSPFLERIFGYDIRESNKAELTKYEELDSLYRTVLLSKYDYGEDYDTYRKVKNQRMELANSIIASFPNEFKYKIGVLTGYSGKIEITSFQIEEGNTRNEIIDFGITYF